MTGEYGSSVERAEGPSFGVIARRLFGNVRLDFGKDLSPPMLISADLGPCRMSRLAAGAHMVTGDNVALKSYDPDAIKLIFQTRGRSLLHQGSSTVEFDAGRAVVYDPTRAYTLDNPEPVTLFLLQVPRAAIRSRALARLVRPLSATETSAGLQHVLLSMMQSCMTEIDRLDGEARRALGATMVELAKNLMDSEAEIAIAPTARSLDTLRQRIKLCIDANLAQPTLDVAAIARVGVGEE